MTQKQQNLQNTSSSSNVDAANNTIESNSSTYATLFSPTTTAKKSSIVRDLGILGWDNLEPAIIASLATEATLLLIGSHGTAKSMLLERLANALQLQFRHYNASILNFDDLIGFPAPASDNKFIRYLRSPLDAWDAEAVFIDEISRCRPDMQNRLFPLIHEKKIQGEALPKLRFRWSAMNPPPSEEDPNSYLGSFALDEAFADRYAWVLPIPTIISSPDRIALFGGLEVHPQAGQRLQMAIQECVGRLHLVKELYKKQIAVFVDALYAVLNRSKLPISIRRGYMIAQNCIAMIATGYYTDIEDALFRATLYSLPHRCQERIEDEQIIRATQTALHIKDFALDDIRRKLLEETDPIRRICIALRAQDDALITATVLDACASLPRPNRLALSVPLFPLLLEEFPNISAIALENLAQDLASIQSLQRNVALVHTNSNQYEQAQSIDKHITSLHVSEDWIKDVLWTLFKQNIDFCVPDLISFCKTIEKEFNTHKSETLYSA